MVSIRRTSLALAGILLLALSTGCRESEPSIPDTGDPPDGRDTTSDADATGDLSESDVPDGDTSEPDTGGLDAGDAGDAGGCKSGQYRTADAGCRPIPRGTPADSCPSGEYTGGDFFTGDGLCLPEDPRGNEADEECPSGKYFASEAFSGDGICQPRLPQLDDWQCTGAWSADPAFVDADGNRAVPERLDGDGVSICTPPDLPDSCPRGQIAPAGASTCEQQGTSCPSGEWLATSEIRNRASGFSGDIHYVTADDGSGGQGTKQTPYHSVSAAISAASDGDVVALGKGTHAETVETGKRIALLGACVTETTLEPPTGSDARRVVSWTRNKGGLLANLAVTGPAVGVYLRGLRGDVRLEAVAIENARKYGVKVVGAPSGTAILDRVAIRSTRRTADDKKGHGLHVHNDGIARLESSVLDGNREAGAFLHNRGDDEHPTVEMVDTVIRRTHPKSPDGAEEYGIGIRASSKTKLTLKRTILQANRQHGLRLEDDGTRAEITQSVVRETMPELQNDRSGVGIRLAGGAHLSAERLLIAESKSSGLRLTDRRDQGPSASLEQVVVRGRAGFRDKFQAGIFMQSTPEATVTGEQVILARPPNVGLKTQLPGPNVELSDSVVWRSDGSGPIQITESTLRLERSLVTDNAHGIFVAGSEAEARLTDVTLRKTNDPWRDKVLRVNYGATVEGTRVDLLDNSNFGVIVGSPDIGDDSDPPPGTRLELDESRIAHRTRPPDDESTFGVGALLLEGDLTLNDSLVQWHLKAGIVADSSRSSVTLRDTVVRETLPPASADAGNGVGVAINNGAGLTMRRVRLRDNFRTDLDIHHPDSAVDIRDLAIDSTSESGSAPETGYGLSIGGDPSAADLRRIAIAGSTGVGMYAEGARDVQVRDLVVEDTAENEVGLGDGAYFFLGSRITLERGLMTGNARHGLVVSDAEATASDAAVTQNGGAAVVRQSKAGWGPTRFRAADNKGGRSQCSQQCYEPPEKPEEVSVPKDNL